MELRELDLNLLLVFNQLLIDRRVSTAADNLELTQPAVSNALKRLRTTLNDELFVRTYQGMEPTPYACQLAEPVALAIQTLRDALSRQNTFDPLSSNRRFTMAMTDIGEIYFMPRLMDALAERAPGCSISTLQQQRRYLGRRATKRFDRPCRRVVASPSGGLFSATPLPPSLRVPVPKRPSCHQGTFDT